MVIEAHSVPDKIVEAIRWQGPSFVVGVQWHPEFMDPNNAGLLDGDPLLMAFLTAAERARPGG